MLMDCYQRNCFRRRGVAEPIDDAGHWQPHPTLRPGLLCFDQLTVLSAIDVTFCDLPFARSPLVYGHDAPAFGALSENTQNSDGVRSNSPDQPGFVCVALIRDLGEARKYPVPFAQRRIGVSGNQEDSRRRPRARPFKWTRKKIAIGIGTLDLKNGNRRQLVWIAIGPLSLFEVTVLLKLAEDPFQLDPIRSLEAKRLCNLALARLRRVSGNPVQYFDFRGNTSHVSPLSRHALAVIVFIRVEGRQQCRHHQGYP